MKFILNFKILVVLFLFRNANAHQQQQQHPYGHPINIMSFTSDFNISVDYENLRSLFLNPEVSNRKAVTISIIGAFRKGKSFILDYFLRYLYAKFNSVNNMAKKTNDQWIGKSSDPLTGFSWKAGVEGHTSGIVFWSDVFLYDADNGEKYAIFLIDTQGLFDVNTPMSENLKIFGLGTLLSSLQIYNLNGLIQEDQLQYLQMATDYARFAIAENKVKGIRGIRTFQNLMFLMRDWENVNEYGYGLDEGRRYLLNILQTDDDQDQDLKEVRLYIKSSFEKVFCFLMPHPGSSVINKDYDGRHSEMDMDFKIELNNLVTWLFNPKNLMPKKVFNQELTAKMLYFYIHAYFEVFQMEVPDVKSIYEATVNSQLKGLVDAALINLKTELSRNFNMDMESFDVAALDNLFLELKGTVVEKFKNEIKMGSASHEQLYLNILSSKIDEYFKNYRTHAIEIHNMTIVFSEKIEQDRLLFIEELNKIIQENQTQIEENIKQIEDELKNEEQKAAQIKVELEMKREELLKNITNDHELSIEEMRISEQFLQDTFNSKLRQIENEEQNKRFIFEKELAQKREEMLLVEQAIKEKELKLDEELKIQEEKNFQKFESEKELTLNLLKFNKDIEQQSFERKLAVSDRQMQHDIQKLQNEQQMEMMRMANQERLVNVQVEISRMKQQKEAELRNYELQASSLRQQNTIQMAGLEIEKNRAHTAAVTDQINAISGAISSVGSTAANVYSAGKAYRQNNMNDYEDLGAAPNSNNQSPNSINGNNPNPNRLSKIKSFVSSMNPFKSRINQNNRTTSNPVQLPTNLDNQTRIGRIKNYFSSVNPVRSKGNIIPINLTNQTSQNEVSNMS